MFHTLPLRLYLIQEDGPTISNIRQARYLPLKIISTFSRTIPSMQANILACKSYTTLCYKRNGSYVIMAEKKEELESKSSHKSDIWPPAASKKWGEIFGEYFFQTSEVFSHKGMFVTKVTKANSIYKNKSFGTCFVRNKHPLEKWQPLWHSAMVRPGSSNSCPSARKPSKFSLSTLASPK